MEFNKLPSIQFAQKDPAAIEQSIIKAYEVLTERTLSPGDPVRLFLLTIASVIIQQRILIDYAGKQNLLAYAAGDNLDHIGILVGTERLPAAAARTTLRISLSQARLQATVIPAGIRITAGDDIYFMTDSAVIIPAGETSINAGAVCTDTGTAGNNYDIGELNKIVDQQPFVDSIVNITRTDGGSELENDAAYRERIRQAPESFSVAGPDGAYKYHAMRASALINDVSVVSPRPGEVEVRPLLIGGKLPEEEILNAVNEILNNKKIRPLTDKVTILKPEPVNYNIDLSYWIDREDAAGAAMIQKAVEKSIQEYILWQKSRLGRDINPSELIYRLRAAGAKRIEVSSPAFTVITAAQVAISDEITAVFGGLEDG